MRGITIGIRAQASVVIAAVSLWCVSVVGCASEVSYRRPGLRFWDIVLGVCPVVAVVFLVTLWWSYLHSMHAHGGWVSAATLAVITPVLLYVFLSLAY
jgi:hypothetical protein